MNMFLKIFKALGKTLGFFAISCFPVIIYFIKYGIAHDGDLPSAYQCYAIQIISICFPIIATTLWLEGSDLKSGIRYLALIMLGTSLIYMAFSDTVCTLKGNFLDNVFSTASFVIYIGTVIISIMKYYSEDMDADQNRRMQQNDTQSKVNWTGRR